MQKYLTGLLWLCLMACNGTKNERNDPDVANFATEPDTAKPQPGSGPDSGSNGNSDSGTHTTVSDTVPPPAAGMQRFCNNEFVGYCFDLPLKDYKQDYNASDLKGKHVFVHKTKKGNDITVQGMMRSDTSVSLENYYAGYYDEERDAGKVVETRGLLMAEKCFYLKGYWSNMIGKYRYIEIIWLRPGEVVTYTANFNVADTALWNNRLKALLDQGSEFK